jgi:hypothetical protein
MRYFIGRVGQQYGPYTWEQLQEHLANGAVVITDRTREEVGSDWVTVAQMAGRLAAQPPLSRPGGAPAFANVSGSAAARATTGIPDYKLFDSGSVALATLFGTPIAGTFLMAMNYRRLGKKDNARWAIAAGVAGTVTAVLLRYVIPQGASAGVAIGMLAATMRASKSLQGDAIEKHVATGGSLGPRWAAFGLGVGALTAVLAVIFLVLLAKEFVTGAATPGVVIGTRDRVSYTGTASREDALVLGGALKAGGFFSDKGSAVSLTRSANGTVVSFVVLEGVWDKRDVVDGFEEVGRQIAPSVGGFPISVRLVDSAGSTRKDLTIGKAIVGTKDEVYYLGEARERQARALGDSLRSAHSLSDNGATVLLAKNDGITAISFVVPEGAWNNPGTVVAFEQIVRQASPSVGGLPVRLRLLDSDLALRKEATVN